MKCELQIRMQAELGLEDSDFATHASDLYVLARPGVIEWLKKNYDFTATITPFKSNPDSEWKGEWALDIPFACFDVRLLEKSERNYPKIQPKTLPQRG